MRKKEAISLIEKLRKIEKSIEVYNKNLNTNLEQLNSLLKILPTILSTIVNIQESFQKDNEIKQLTNKKVDKLIEEVNYANKRLEA